METSSAFKAQKDASCLPGKTTHLLWNDCMWWTLYSSLDINSDLLFHFFSGFSVFWLYSPKRRDFGLRKLICEAGSGEAAFSLFSLSIFATWVLLFWYYIGCFEWFLVVLFGICIGLEASVADSEGSIIVKNPQIVVESQDNDMMQVSLQD